MSHLFLPPIELAKVISGPVGYEAQLSAGCRRLISRVERFGLVVAVVYGELSAPQRGSGVEQRRGPDPQCLHVADETEVIVMAVDVPHEVVHE